MQTPFEHAVRAHGPTVLRVVRATLGPGADADDAWSETFLAALRSWPDLDPDTNLEAWLVRVAHRKCLDVVRARRAVPTDPPPDTVSTLGQPDTVHDDLWAQVAALPERQRLALAYHYAGGLPHTETALIIGGSPQSVRRAAADGMRTLRRQFAQPGAPQ